MFIVGKTICFFFLLFLSIALFLGQGSDNIIAFIDNTSLVIARSQYETGLVEMHTDFESGEFGMPVIHRMFSDIRNLNQLNDYADLEVADLYSDGLDRDSYWVKGIEYNGEEYDICAYVFPDANTSMQYYENFTGNPSFGHETWYEWCREPAPCFIAYDDESALRIEGRNIEVIAILLETFPSVFDVEMTASQEIMEQALNSGQLEKVMEQYALDKYGIMIKMTE